jgi:hypothetical protein
LVNDVRPRYVKADLLPPKREKSLVEALAAERKKKEVEAFRNKNRLNSSAKINDARAMMEAAVAEQAESATADDDAAGGDDADNKADPADDGKFTGVAEKRAVARAAAISRLFLKPEPPKYGAGRITSTHNMKGKIEMPWSTTKGRQTTLPGDRTA